MVNSLYGTPVAQLLDIAYQQSPAKEALYDGTRRWTFADLHAEAEAAASGLIRLGIRPGDRVAVCLPGWYEFIVLVYAIAKAGAILVPFNTRYREMEAEHILRDSGARAVFFPKEYDQVSQLNQLLSIRQRLPGLEFLIPVRFSHEGMTNFEELLELGRGQPLPELNVNVKEDVYALIYTSGTTGKPKGVMLTHHNLVQTSIKSVMAINAGKTDVFLQASPFFHIMGLAAILRLVICQAKMVLLEFYKAERVLQLIEQEKITIHPGVPAMFTLEMNHPNFRNFDLSSLRVAIMAGAPCPVEIIRRLKAEMGCPVLVSYGMTETSPSLTMTAFDDDDIIQSETVGRAMEGVELKVVDDNRQELPCGQVGELAARTEGLMKGYYNLPDMTREVVDDEGWFYTGDLATIDEQGYVRIVGRKKDMIIRGGYNIYPREIEEVFYTHPAVMEVAIVGLPDSVLGEISCAAIRLKPEMQATPEELKAFIADKIADYKRPDHVVIVGDMPKTASGKIMKFELKEAILQNGQVALR